MLYLFDVLKIKQRFLLQMDEIKEEGEDSLLHPMAGRSIQVKMQYALIYTHFFRDLGLFPLLLRKESPFWAKLLQGLSLSEQIDLFLDLINVEKIDEKWILEQSDMILLHMEIITVFEFLSGKSDHVLFRLNKPWDLLDKGLPKIQPNHKTCLHLIKQLLPCTTKTARVKIYRELLIPVKLHNLCEKHFFKRGF